MCNFNIILLIVLSILIIILIVGNTSSFEYTKVDIDNGKKALEELEYMISNGSEIQSVSDEEIKELENDIYIWK